jgi:hypothetical protein
MMINKPQSGTVKQFGSTEQGGRERDRAEHSQFDFFVYRDTKSRKKFEDRKTLPKEIFHLLYFVDFCFSPFFIMCGFLLLLVQVLPVGNHELLKREESLLLDFLALVHQQLHYGYLNIQLLGNAVTIIQK